MRKHIAKLTPLIFLCWATLLAGNAQGANTNESKRVWLSSACYKLNLGVRDKFLNGPYLAKYVVKAADGRSFVAERNGNDDPNAAEVVFPDDFYDEKTNLAAWINCRYGKAIRGRFMQTVN